MRVMGTGLGDEAFDGAAGILVSASIRMRAAEHDCDHDKDHDHDFDHEASSLRAQRSNPAPLLSSLVEPRRWLASSSLRSSSQ
jgi:hypothetical protein